MATLTGQTGQGSNAAPPASAADQVRLLDLFDTIRSRWRGILTGAIIGLLVGTAAALAQPLQHVSTVRIWVRDAPRTLDPTFASNQRNISIDTEAQRLVSQPVLTAAGISDPDAVSVTVPSNSAILRVRVTADDPQTAQDQARALSAAYLDARRRYLEQRRATRNDAIAAQQDLLTAGLQNATNAAERERWQAALDRLLADRTYFDSASTDPGRVVRAASEGQRAKRNWEVPPLSAATIGALTGFALAYVVSVYRRTEDR